MTLLGQYIHIYVSDYVDDNEQSSWLLQSVGDQEFQYL